VASFHLRGLTLTERREIHLKAGQARQTANDWLLVLIRSAIGSPEATPRERTILDEIREEWAIPGTPRYERWKAEQAARGEAPEPAAEAADPEPVDYSREGMCRALGLDPATGEPIAEAAGE
jgi:hypothetical protein